MKLKISIIIPIYNEVDSIFSLINELLIVFKNIDAEIIIVNDGSTDNFSQTFKNYKNKNKIKVVMHDINKGKCMAMLTGIRKAKNKLIGIIDGDGQNPPQELLKMFKFWKIKVNDTEKFSIVCGFRFKRKDTLMKKISSKAANYVRRKILNDDCFDTACAMKVFNKNDYLKIPYFVNVHRFLPALFKMNNGRIHNFKVLDRPRIKGLSKYNFNNRFWIGIKDLYKVWKLTQKRSDYVSHS